MAASNRAQLRLQSFAAFALYLTLAIVLFARGLFGHPDCVLGQGTDPPQTMWFFNWWRFAIAHWLNPFFTDFVWAPIGINLTWTTLVPLPGIASIPFQVTVGEPASYNVMALLTLALAAISGFLLCYRVTSSFWPSLLGGYVFGFSPYVLGQLLAHLVEFTIFPIPLIALLVLNRIDEKVSARRFAILLAALLIVEFLCAAELLATVTIVGVFALLIALAVFGGETRGRITRLIQPAIVGYLLTGLVLSPYLYQMLARDFPQAPIWPPDYFSADLLAFVVPTATNLFGTMRAAAGVASSFSGDIYENGAYIGIPLILFVELFRRRYWKTPQGKFLTVTLIVLVIAAMGSSLHVAGKAGLPLPWAVLGSLPILSIALPVRLMLYAFLVIAVMLAIWFASSTVSLWTKCAAAALILASIAPNPHASFWVSRLDIPAFFTDRAYASELKPSEIILPLPWAQKGNCMYWQLESDMYFRMAGGWTGRSPFEFDRMPIVNYFFGGIDLPEAGDQLKAYVARFEVQSIIADPNDGHFESFKQTLDSIGVAARNEKGVWLYKIPPDSFAEYRKLTAAYVESRANALRFDTILEAAAKYLADGHDLSKLSAEELKRLDLLPYDWLIDLKNIDWAAGQAPDGRIAIAVFGSYEGVKPLIERYRTVASEIDYPAPRRWNPQSSPAEDRLDTLLIIFDRAQFETAANQLRSSPPPEMTTPFLGADSHR